MTPADVAALGVALVALVAVAALAGVGIGVWLDGLAGRDWDQETEEIDG